MKNLRLISYVHTYPSDFKTAELKKKVRPPALRHPHTIHFLDNGNDICPKEELLGHNSIKTTQIYTTISKKSLAKIKSPLDTIIESQYVEKQGFKMNKNR